MRNFEFLLASSRNQHDPKITVAFVAHLQIGLVGFRYLSEFLLTGNGDSRIMSTSVDIFIKVL